MFSVDNKPNKKHITKHPTKRRVLIKFLVVVAIFLAYFFFVAGRLGFENGFYVTVVTWSFFVLSTPIADAGFLLDFPLRLTLGIRMLLSEAMVWLVAILLNLYTLNFRPDVYESTDLLRVFETILTNPWPYWWIIVISAIGTFMSVVFGDELIDKAQHRHRVIYHKHKFKYRLIIMVFIIIGALILYDILLKKLGYDFSI